MRFEVTPVYKVPFLLPARIYSRLLIHRLPSFFWIPAFAGMTKWGLGIESERHDYSFSPFYKNKYAKIG
jgi:hypothetical protein